MPKNAAIKNAARERQAQTGESYTEARAAVVAEHDKFRGLPVGVPKVTVMLNLDDAEALVNGLRGYAREQMRDDPDYAGHDLPEVEFDPYPEQLCAAADVIEQAILGTPTPDKPWQLSVVKTEPGAEPVFVITNAYTGESFTVTWDADGTRTLTKSAINAE